MRFWHDQTFTACNWSDLLPVRAGPTQFNSTACPEVGDLQRGWEGKDTHTESFWLSSLCMQAWFSAILLRRTTSYSLGTGLYDAWKEESSCVVSNVDVWSTMWSRLCYFAIGALLKVSLSMNQTRCEWCVNKLCVSTVSNALLRVLLIIPPSVHICNCCLYPEEEKNCCGNRGRKYALCLWCVCFSEITHYWFWVIKWLLEGNASGLVITTSLTMSGIRFDYLMWCIGHLQKSIHKERKIIVNLEGHYRRL